MKEADARPSDQGEHDGMLTAFEWYYLLGVGRSLEKLQLLPVVNHFPH